MESELEHLPVSPEIDAIERENERLEAELKSLQDAPAPVVKSASKASAPSLVTGAFNAAAHLLGFTGPPPHPGQEALPASRPSTLPSPLQATPVTGSALLRPPDLPPIAADEQPPQVAAWAARSADHRPHDTAVSTWLARAQEFADQQILAPALTK